MENNHILLRPASAAKFLGLSASTLAKMRLKGNGPRYAKLGDRAVLYDTADLLRWVEDRKRKSTSEQSSKMSRLDRHA